jgi:hypothetical protein
MTNMWTPGHNSHSSHMLPTFITCVFNMPCRLLQNANTAYAVGGSGSLFKSEDGGK